MSCWAGRDSGRFAGSRGTLSVSSLFREASANWPALCLSRLRVFIGRVQNIVGGNVQAHDDQPHKNK